MAYLSEADLKAELNQIRRGRPPEPGSRRATARNRSDWIDRAARHLAEHRLEGPLAEHAERVICLRAGTIGGAGEYWAARKPSTGWERLARAELRKLAHTALHQAGEHPAGNTTSARDINDTIALARSHAAPESVRKIPEPAIARTPHDIDTGETVDQPAAANALLEIGADGHIAAKPIPPSYWLPHRLAAPWPDITPGEIPNAPLWQKHLRTSLPQQHLRHHVEIRMGQTFLGRTKHEIITALIGPGRSGKSFITKICAGIIGKDRAPNVGAITALAGRFASRYYSAQMLTLTELTIPKRLTPQMALAVGIIKALSGGEPLSTEIKHVDGIWTPDTVPNLWIATNRMRLNIASHSDELVAWLERLDPTRFPATLPLDQRIPELDQMILNAEAPLILARCAARYAHAAAEGPIPIPAENRQLRRELITAGLPLAIQAAAALTRQQPGHEVTTIDLAAAIEEWRRTTRNPVKPGNRAILAAIRKLHAADGHRTRHPETGQQTTAYAGIALRSPYSEPF